MVQTWYFGLSEMGMTLEAWSSGWLFCGAIILTGFTIANMSGRLLHWLILLELLLAIPRSLQVFFNFDGRSWAFSSVCVPLYMSYVLHDIIAWMKVRPFLSRRASFLFIGSFALCIPYWILETYGNFIYFNYKIKHPFTITRVLEAVFRDPWWIFACVNLLYNVKKRYGFGVIEIIRLAPRFGVMLVAMILSIAFLLTDVGVTFKPLDGATGINPFWKISMVLKCFCDTIVLDDFKTALDRLRNSALSRSKGRKYSEAASAQTSALRSTIRDQAKSAVDIEKGDEDIELGRHTDRIFVERTVAVEEVDSHAMWSTPATPLTPTKPAPSGSKFWTNIKR